MCRSLTFTRFQHGVAVAVVERESATGLAERVQLLDEAAQVALLIALNRIHCRHVGVASSPFFGSTNTSTSNYLECQFVKSKPVKYHRWLLTLWYDINSCAFSNNCAFALQMSLRSSKVADVLISHRTTSHVPHCFRPTGKEFNSRYVVRAAMLQARSENPLRSQRPCCCEPENTNNPLSAPNPARPRHCADVTQPTPNNTSNQSPDPPHPNPNQQSQTS